jgi:hypothetical protein
VTPRHLQLAFPIRADSATERIRDALIGVIQVAFGDLPTCDAILVAAGELVENAARFGRWDGARFPFELEIDAESDHFVVRASNPIRAGEANLKRLGEALKAIGRSPSTREAYLDGMRRAALAASGEAAVAAGGLGLARITHECGCQVTFDCTVDGKLTVQAASRRRARPTPLPPA